MQQSKIVHLHTHSHYSLLSALPKIPELVAVAKKGGIGALGLTDLGNLYGAIEFYKECTGQGIKPIIGVEAYTAARTISDKQAGIDNRRGRLILLAENITGYKNLLKLVTVANMEGFYYRPRIDQELLEKYSEGLIAISPAYGGDIAQAIKNKDREKAAERAAWFLKRFGTNRFFIEITRHPEVEGFDIPDLVTFAREQKIEIVAGHDVYYLSPDDKQAHDTIQSVQNNPDYGEISTPENGLDLSLLSAEHLNERFKDIPEALANAAKIAERSSLELALGKWIFPDYQTAKGVGHDEELRKKAYEGLSIRGMEKTPEIEKRIDYELSIIKNKGYAPYFLVVADLLKYARDHQIVTTTRGSAGGSLVSYLTYITTTDPIAYKLPFERFLNPERPKAPDIDMDIADDRRDELIAYAKQKYGADRVAQVGTFGTMMARGAVRDVARALGYEYAVGDRISKLIPFGSQGFPMYIDRALEMVPELKEAYKKEKDVRDIINMAKKIEGCVRHIGVHAAGVVIAPTPLTDYTPLQYDPKGEGKIITQYDMYSITDEYGGVGLLKFDFLGIKNLAILADAAERVEKIEGKKIDLETIPLDDKKTFDMLGRGETTGVFQLGGTGMTHYLKDLRPSTIHDINAMVALYRPGPMESIPRYIERKHNPRLVSYLDPRLKDILDQSYGVITYQDDVLLVAVKLGGYSWLEADALRKAMGKKIPAEMEAQKEKLIAGFVKNGMTPEKAQDLWKLIEPFAAYGFNKAHAASYGKVAYQTAYLKANFPAIYLSAVLTADSGDVERIGETIAECKRMGIPVLPPDVNESFEGFTVVKNPNEADKIRFGLTTIKNFGEGIAASIITERKKSGKFKSLGDFLERIHDRNLNKKSLESLIKCGALDSFGERGAMLSNIENLLEYHKEHADSDKDQTSLFGDTPNVGNLRLASAPQASAPEKLAWEKELLGLYISGHPLDKFRTLLEKREVNVRRVKEEYREGMQVVLGGILEEMKSIITKNNEQMAFVRLADLSGSIEAVIFPRIFKQQKSLLGPEACIAIKGRVSERNGEQSIIVESLRALESTKEK